MIFGDLTKRSKFTGAGIRKNDIEFAFLFLDCRVKFVEIFQFGYVTLNARCVTANLTNCGV